MTSPPVGEDPAPARPLKAATSYDVAARAGVSVGTVSNVFNRPHIVAAATVRRVEQAARDLGWTRDLVAQQMRGGRSTAIGAVVVELSPHTVSLLSGIEQRLDNAGYTLQISTSNFRGDHEQRRVELLQAQRVRGLILSPIVGYTAYLHTLRRLNIALVLLGRRPPSGICSVASDDTAGGHLAISHLVSLGHRRIAVVGGTSAKHPVRQRRAGASAAAAHVTPNGPVELIRIPTTGYDIPAGIAATQQVINDKPTAVFAINDRIAIGLQHGLLAAGLTIPDDIAVIGYDNTAAAATAPIPLTTIHNPHDEIAHHAARLLLDEIAHRDDSHAHHHEQISLEPSLIIRNSTEIGSDVAGDGPLSAPPESELRLTGCGPCTNDQP